MKFTLTIELGNSAMQNVGHVEDALRELADSGRLSRYVDNAQNFVEEDSAPIRDVNGNKVGEWSVSA